MHRLIQLGKLIIILVFQFQMDSLLLAVKYFLENIWNMSIFSEMTNFKWAIKCCRSDAKCKILIIYLFPFQEQTSYNNNKFFIVFSGSKR